MNINARWIWTAILAVPLVAGCNRAESPSEVQEDVAEAQRDAAENVAEEREDLYTAQPTDEYVEESREVAIARAEGDHKVAIERCEALEGDMQRNCKEQADAELAAAKARVDSAMTPQS